MLAVAPGTAIITATADGKSGASTFAVLDGGVVSSDGATLNLQSGAVQVVVPRDALASKTSLSVVASKAFAGDSGAITGTAFEFGPTGTSFSKAVSLRIKYDPANLPPGTEEAELEIVSLTDSGSKVVEGSAVDVFAKVVQVKVPQFGAFAVSSNWVATVSISGPADKPIVNGGLALLVGESAQLKAVVRASDGRILSGKAVTWKSSDSTTATITANGLLTARKQGAASISASSGGKSSSVALTVRPMPVATVTVSPASASVVVGGTQQLSAVAKDATGNALAGRAVTWSSGNTAAATVSAAGLVTAVGSGNTTITATSETKTGTSSITVTLVPVATVTVSPATPSVVVGGTQQLSAVTKDSNGNVVTGRSVTWSTSDPAVATVEVNGLVTAVAAGGPVTITATSETRTGTSSITVTLVPVSTVAVSPATASVVVGGTQQLSAVTKDATGNVFAGRTVTWSTSDAAVATVSSTGLVTAVGAGGPVTITATSETKTGTASITVTLAPVNAVTISTPTTPMVVGGTQQLSAVTKDATGNVLTGRTVNWVSSNTAVLTVSPVSSTSGTTTVTAVGVGTATTTATSESVSSTPTPVITVDPVAVATVTVAPASASLVVGVTQQLTAVTKDAAGNELTGRLVTWASSNPAAATVDGSGLVIGVAAGGPVTITATSETKTGASSITVPLVPVATVTVTPPSVSLVVGVLPTQQLSAVTKDAGGNVLPGRTVTWSTSDAAVATVDVSGLVSAVAAGGPVTITATSEAKTGTSQITVTLVPIATVTVSPASPSLVAGGTQQLTATANDATGNLLTGRAVTWSTSDAAVATVSSTGLVTAVGAGSTTITATSETKTGTSSITVTLAPVNTVTISSPTTPIMVSETQVLTATPKDAGGNTLAGRTVNWVSSNPAALMVSAPSSVSTSSGATMTVTAVGVGTATITATSESVSSMPTPLITVNPVSVATVTVTPSSASLVLGVTPTQQLAAVTKDGTGNVLTGRTVDWTSSNTAAATVSSTGLVTAVGAGAATITATSETKTGTSSITVSPVPVATLTISAPTTPMVLGGTQELTATTKDSNGNVLTGRTVSWVSSNAAVLTVSPASSTTGTITITAVGAGTATITATSESVSSTPTPVITATLAPVNTVTLSPPSAGLVVGGKQQLTATLRDAAINVLTDRVVTWASDNAAAATVDGNGLVTGLAAGGPVTITATSETKTGTSQITVAPVPVATVTVSPASGSLVVGGTQQLSVVTKDAAGNVLTGRTVTWSTSDATMATVSSTGLVAAVGAGGPVTITATSETKTGTSQITVASVPVATVTVNPASASVVVGGTQQLAATTKDANGNVLAGRTISWSSSNPGISTVSTSGLVSAVAAGNATITATSEGKSGGAAIAVVVAAVPTETFTGAGGALANPPWRQQRTSGTVSRNGSGLGIGSVNAKDLHAFWNGVTFNNDQYSQVKIAGGLAPSAQYAIVLVRASGVGDAADNNYAFASDGASGVGHTDLSKNINGTQTILRNFATTFAAGDIMKITVTGTLITCYKNSVSIGTFTDASLASGSPGVGMYGSTVTIDDWEGGSYGAQVSVATVTVSPAAASLAVGGTQQLSAVTKDANGNVLTGRTVTWNSGNTAAATVSSTGLVIGVGAGNPVTITATSETKTGTSQITVALVPVTTVTVSPPSASVVVGGMQQLTATTNAANGNVLTGRAVTWNSGNTAAATVSPTGLVTAVGAGPATITATSETKTGTSQITVTPSTGVVGPLRVSTVNPRYFADASGRIVYLTGSHYWKNVQDNGITNPPSAFENTAFLNFLVNHNHNFTKLWVWEHARKSSLTSVDHWFSPTLYARPGPGTALDDGPKFDLSQINPVYLARLRQRVIDAGVRAIYVSVMLFNGWSVETKPSFTANNPWLAHPFNAANNINGINGDPNGDQLGTETETLSIPAVTALQETFVKAVVDAVNDLDNVIYEIVNETSGSPEAVAWQYHMIDVVRSYEATKPKQHPIGMTVPWPKGVNSDVLNSTASWVGMNGDIYNPVVADGAKVSLSDTDHLCGICGDATWPWKTFTRGHNPVLMDGYDGSPGYTDPAYNPNNPVWEVIRTNMGYARSYALRMDLAHAVPRGDLASSSYCLAVVGSEYLVFLPNGGSVSVNLTGVSGSRTVEWFNPGNGQTSAGGTVTGGGTVNLTAPFSGMATAYIHP